MTAIVGVLNTQGIAIAADSAATISSSQNVKKVHNKGNKIFTLSKYHPVGIAIYSGANFMGIPWEILIKMYRGQLKGNSFDKLENYRDDFMKYLHDNLALISKESKGNHFYSLANNVYSDINSRIQAEINAEQVNLLAAVDKVVFIQGLLDKVVKQIKADIGKVKQNPNFKIDYNKFKAEYTDELIQINLWITHSVNSLVPGLNPAFSISAQNAEDIKEVIHLSTLMEYLFESYTGLVFIGYGNKEIFPSSLQVLVGSVVTDCIRHTVVNPIIISPGLVEANIIPYAQSDVTYSVLTGINPKVNQQINSSIQKTIDSIKDIFKAKGLSADEEKKLGEIPKMFEDELKKFTYDSITAPLLDMLIHMNKEDMAELAESLVNVTSLVSKFTETNESVGGPVDVAIITKGDGFVWIKRKHYFDTELNKNFLTKYYK